MPSGVRSRGVTPVPPGGEHDPGAGGDGGLNGGAHRLGPVGHDARLVDDDVVLGQEPDGQGPGGVLSLPAGAAVRDGDDRSPDRLRQRVQGLLDDLVGGGLTARARTGGGGGGRVGTGAVGALRHAVTVTRPRQRRTADY